MKRLPDKDVQRATLWLSQAARLLRELSEVAETLSATLDESRRVRGALNRCRYPVDIEQLMLVVKNADITLAEALELCEFDRFELGKLHLTAPDSITWVRTHMRLDSLRKILEQYYKVPFNVKVREK